MTSVLSELESTTAAIALPIDTRRAAAERMQGHTGPLRERVFRYVRLRGDHGATDVEISDGLGILRDSVRPRRLELERAGRLADSGRRRRTPSGRLATVWISTGEAEGAAKDLRQTAGTPQPDGQTRAASGNGTPAKSCRCCRGKRFWQSVYGVTICENCHPPASEALVAARIGPGGNGEETEGHE